MTFPILGGNSAVGGYAIDNSLRFNDNDSPTLSRTPASTGNRKTWTFSYWIKRSNISIVQQTFAVGTNASTPWFLNYINSDDTLHIWMHDGTNSYFSTGLNKLRDVGAWYHIMYVVDTTQSTASDRFKVYLNGSEITWNSYNPPAQNFDTEVNTTSTHYIGRAGNGQYFDGYTAEVHFIDGQALSPTDFGEFDEDSGIWKPIQYTGSYGTNGFYLDFENSGSLGTDQSGNGNDFTPTNLASTDQTTDTPTNNFATFNALIKEGGTLSEGNLKSTGDGSSPSDNSVSTMGANTGKWYAEFELTTDSTNSTFGICDEQSDFFDAGNNIQSSTVNGIGMRDDGNMYNYGTENSSWGTSFTTNDILQIALDMDNGYVYFGKNGTWMNSGVPTSGSSGTGGVSITNTDRNYFMFVGESFYNATPVWSANFGNPSFSITSGNTDENGYGNFEYAPPSGFLALCTQNLATALSPTIDDGSQYFSSTLYTGDGTTSNAITGVGFQGDFAWFKARSSAYSHMLFDSTRGGDARLNSDATYAESTGSDRIQSFDSDGYTISTNTAMNNSGTSFVVWSWLANGGTTSSNTDGSITSTVQANTTAGFSIVTYTGTGSNATVGHGLTSAPELVIYRNRDYVTNWAVYSKEIGAGNRLYLSATDASTASSVSFNSTDPTSSVLSVGTYETTNRSGDSMLAYCFHSVEGYSKFGSYTGNGNTDGTFVYTGFRPAFVIIKVTSTTENWVIRDNKRDTYNNVYHQLLANASSVEDTSNDGRFSQDFLSNGFKIRATHATTNQSGASYIYMAFAENPFVTSSGVPVVAR